MPQSNINSMYEGIVRDLSQRAKMIMDEGSLDERTDETDAILQAIDEGLTYYSDEAYIIAHAFINGLFSWNEQICWDCLLEDLITDIADDLKFLRSLD